MLHMEIVQERLEREFDMTVITTVPSVQFHAYSSKGDLLKVNAPSEMPEPNFIDRIEEPYIKAQIISKSEFVGPIITLCMDKRGVLKNQTYLTSDRVELQFEMPLAEIVFDFFDKLKTLSRGYASLDYELSGFRESNMVKLDIMLNAEKVDALSAIVHRDKAYDWGKRLCEKLRELLPRQMFEIAIQAAIGQKIIARETVKAMRKNVLAKCYGGDISRKRKLLEKQKKGKKRMRQVGNVEIPQEAFLAVLKLD
jgi:GTP-binding protein LepA